jgi:hypothetical protein
MPKHGILFPRQSLMNGRRMNALMAEMTPYLLAGIFGLIGWYLRDNSKRHQALVQSISSFGATLAGLEQKIEDKIDANSRRFDKFVLSQEARMTKVETRCAIEHGDLPERRANNVVNWDQNSDLGQGIKNPR